MSHLHLPRIHFRGECRADVSTCNNDDLAVMFPDQQFVDSANVSLNTHGMDDAAFYTWIREIATPFGIRGGWNLYGSCDFDFRNTAVQSVHTSQGGLVQDAADDPVIGARVQLRKAVIVDVDPEGTLGTQIFCDEFALRTRDGLSVIGAPTRFYSRWIGRRNLQASGFTAFAAVWHAVLPSDLMTISGGDSDALNALRSASEEGDGLFVEFCTYFLSPQVPQSQLAQDFANDRPTPNPAYGRIVGTVGVWHQSEMETIPVGRRLNPAAQLQHDHTTYQLNPSVALVDPERKVVALDLIQTFPEVNESLAKVNLGGVSLALIHGGAEGEEVHTLGPIEYDQAAYERQSGLVDVPFSDEVGPLLENGRLVLIQDSAGAVVLAEQDLTVETDQRGVYLQENEEQSITLKVHEKGKTATNSTTVRLRQYVTTNRSFSLANAQSAIVEVPAEVEIPAGGSLNLSMTALRPGTCILVFLPPDEPLNSRQFFTNIRVLPEDNYDHVTDDELNFQLIYQEVLRYYYFLYPAMNEEFDLSKELKVRLRAQQIQEVIAKSNWNKWSYMPRTRELSDGKRKLLERWCEKVLS